MTSVDTGCDTDQPLCVQVGTADVCVTCVDAGNGTQDTGCTGATPVCAGTGNNAACVTCEDSNPDATAGATPDFGCAADAPYCDVNVNMGMTTATCRECINAGQCGPGNTCTGNVCVPRLACPTAPDPADCDGDGIPNLVEDPTTTAWSTRAKPIRRLRTPTATA